MSESTAPPGGAIDARAVVAFVLAVAALALLNWSLLAVVTAGVALGVAFWSRAHLRADPRLRGARLGAGAAILAAGVLVLSAVPAALTVSWAVS